MYGNMANPIMYPMMALNQNLQQQINELFNKVGQLEETNKSLQGRIAQLEDKSRKLKDQNDQL